MKIINSMLTKNPCYKEGKKITVRGLMLHSVGVPQPNASAFINSWNSPSYNRACVHAFIDGNSGDVYQCLPWNCRGWHGGGSCNDTHIGVEMCEPATIKYTSGSNWKDNNPANTKAVVMRTYESAVQLFAQLCNTYKLDPLKNGVIVSHSEGNKLGIASNHGDVEHVWKRFGITMTQFRNDVSKRMKNSNQATSTVTQNITVGSLYKVQVGAFSVKANADALLSRLKKDGFNGFVTVVSSLYKVQVGAFSVKANADDMLNRIKNKGYDGFITMTSGSPKTPTKYDSSVKECKKSIEEIAREVILGKWGNGDTRKNKLQAAGYNYSEVQKYVNKLS